MSTKFKDTNGEKVSYRTPMAAYVADISERTVQRYVASGELPSVRLGKIRLIRREALENFLAARESGAGPDSESSAS
jgi:excisionase family DNA binding protein